jgi:hypothetical protein
MLKGTPTTPGRGSILDNPPRTGFLTSLVENEAIPSSNAQPPSSPLALLGQRVQGEQLGVVPEPAGAQPKPT